MKMTQVFKSLGPIDARNVRRDSLANWMIFIPFLPAFFIRWALPPLSHGVLVRYGLDLTPYYPLIMSFFFILLNPILFGMVIGMLLLDERDDHTLTALQVTPLSLNNYLAYRISAPILLSVVITIAIYPIANLGVMNFKALLIAAAAASPMVPIFALALSSIAQNKVQGFALMKASGAFLMPSLIAFFIHSKWELAFGLFPTYWPIKAYWLASAGEPGAGLYVLIGLAYQGILLWLLVRHFNKTMHR